MQQAHSYRPCRFFLITFLLTWIPWFIAAYFSYQERMADYQMVFMLIGLFGPSVAALIMLSGPQNKWLRKDFWGKLHVNRIKPRFLPVLFLFVPVVVILATTFSLFFGLSTDQFAVSEEYMVLKEHAVISLALLSLAPIFEELGWRGYGVDSLRETCNLFTTSILFGFLWAMWHLPLFFIRGYYHHGLWEANFLYVINFFVSILAVSILMNWLYFKNNRSIIVAIIFHFMLDIFYVIFQTDPFTKCIATVLMLIVATILILKDRSFFFGIEQSN